MTWDFSWKMRSFTSNDELQTYHYTPQGHLASVNEDIYTYDFGGCGIGVLTETPLWNVPGNGIDLFGKTIAELRSEKLIPIHYDEMGQVKAYHHQTLEWNPWGQLVKVTGPSYVWEATYDAFGRRLQTRYTPSWGFTLTTTSIYDPEEEFQEIGVKLNGKTYWKIYGPETCDAVMDDIEVIYLSYNALGHLSELITRQEIIELPSTLSPYGPLKGTPFTKPELHRLATSLTWHSKAPDLTGFIWMGARYYDPSSSKFLSPDPIGYPINMNLYAYANGDPINCFDPDGRFLSPIYATTRENVLGAFRFAQSFSDQFQQGFAQGYLESRTSFGPSKLQSLNSINNTVMTMSHDLGAFEGRMQATFAPITRVLFPERHGVTYCELPMPGWLGNYFKKIGSVKKTPNAINIIQDNRPATSSISAFLLRNKLIAEEISGGHAYTKHVINQGEFPGFSTAQFNDHIRNILNNPTEVKALLHGRLGFWDQNSQTLIIRNPEAIDGD